MSSISNKKVAGAVVVAGAAALDLNANAVTAFAICGRWTSLAGLVAHEWGLGVS